MAENSIQDTIINAATAHGVDPTTMLAIAQIESNYNPNASNPSGATGLFQFMPATAAQYGLTNRRDATASANAAAQLLADNAASLTRALGRAPTTGELYLAHQQGAQGAINLLTHPDQSAASIVGSNAVTQNGGRAGMTAAQFANMWTNQADQVASRIPPTNTPEVGSAYADTSPTPPIPVARSAAIAAINAATNARRPNGNAGDALAQNPITTADFGVSPGAPTITPQFDTLGLATGRDGTPYYSLPGAEPYGGYIPGFDGGSGALPSSVPLPRADPRLTPVSPLPRTALQTPIPTTPLPAATQVASAAKPTVTVNGHTYEVGSILKSGSNYYKVQPDGSFVKAQTLPIGQGTVASGIAAPMLQSAIQQAQAAAPGALASAGGAISGLFGNLFGGGKPVPPMDVPVNKTSSVPQSYGPAGGYYSPPQSVIPQATANGLDALAPVADRSEQLSQYNLANQPSYTTPTSYGGYIPGGTSPVPLASPNAMTLPTPAPKYQTVVNPAYTAWLNNQTPAASPFTNPGVQGLSPDDRDSPNGVAQAVPGLTSSVFSKPAPSHYITVKVPSSPIPQPTPVVPLSPDPSELAALREQAMNPFQRFYGSTPLGHITNFLSGGTQGYGAPQQGGLLGLLSHGFGGMSLPQPAPAMPVNNLANLMKMGLSSGQANSYLSGGAAAQAANPNPIMGAITGALNPQYGSIAAPSSGSVISPFHSF
jgi:hypothetical protein